MELLSIEHINEQYLSYSDLRGVRKWLKNKDISVIKLGKKQYVQKVEFQNMMRNITGINKTIKRIKKHQQLNDQEKNIYSQLLEKI